LGKDVRKPHGGGGLLTLYILTYLLTYWQPHDLQQTVHCG